MASIFISYRRADSMAETGRIYDRLTQAFGGRHIFKDVEDIPAGEDFRQVLDRALTAADVVLVIIGPSWALMADSSGKRRLADPYDFVRIEVETALKRNDVTVIPVLVDNATMPSADQLPDGLKDLAFRNSVVVRNDPDFNRDITLLIKTIQRRFDSSNRLPLIAGVLVALAVVVVIGLLVLRGGNPPVPTATPTTVAQAATEQPTSEPTIAPTEPPAGNPTPTVLYPDGRLLQFFYNGSSFYVNNASSGSVPFRQIDFEALNAAGQSADIQFDGNRWAQRFSNLLRQGCGALEPGQFSSQLKPDECKQMNSTISLLDNDELFWRAADNVSSFRLIWDGKEVGRCPAVETADRTKTTCEVWIPAS
jgi:hypothetical protein